MKRTEVILRAMAKKITRRQTAESWRPPFASAHRFLNLLAAVGQASTMASAHHRRVEIAA